MLCPVGRTVRDSDFCCEIFTKYSFVKITVYNGMPLVESRVIEI